MIKLSLVIISLLFIPVSAQTPAAVPVIVVLKSRTVPQYNTAFDSFTKTLKSHGISPTYVCFDLKGSRDEGRRIIGNVRLLKPTLVLTIGTIATETAREHISGAPIVFSMVLNPVDTTLVKSMASSGNNLTGAALDIPVRSQFNAIRTILPHVKKIGVIYDPKETVSVIAEAGKAAREMGMELFAVPVGQQNDMPRALSEIKAYKVDCLWAVSDSTVFSSYASIQFVIMFALQNRLPFIGLSSSFVRFGALMAFSADPADNGAQAGDIAMRVLAGEKPSHIPIATPGKISLSLNARVAAQISISIPAETLATTKEVYK